MKTIVFCFLGIALASTALRGLHAQPAAGTPPVPSVIPGITPELTGWKIEKGTPRVLEESQKGPGGGRIVRIEGEASMTAPIQGFVGGKESAYTATFVFRRLSPGNGWAGCVQVYGIANRVLISPISYQKRYPESGEAWTTVSDTFKLPANADSATFQIMTKPESVIEITDVTCTPAAPGPEANYR